MLALVEEIGEVAQEIALIERIGTKANWQKAPSKERLAIELTHAMNLLHHLADYYDIELSHIVPPNTPTP